MQQQHDINGLETLERLVEQQINLGLKNPHECFDRLVQQFGPADLVEIARPYLSDFITEMARHKINAQRRQSIAKITPTTVADPEVKLRSLWVPSEIREQGIVYKRIADMTAEDFDARAAYLERMLVGLSRHIGWCREVANEIRRTKKQTAGQLKALPALPEIDDLVAE
jgi:hypothetical protein